MCVAIPSSNANGLQDTMVIGGFSPGVPSELARSTVVYSSSNGNWSDGPDLPSNAMYSVPATIGSDVYVASRTGALASISGNAGGSFSKPSAGGVIHLGACSLTLFSLVLVARCAQLKLSALTAHHRS